MSSLQQPYGYSDLPSHSADNLHRMEPQSGFTSNASPWLEREQSRSKRSKWIVMGSIAAIAVIVVVAVVVGVVVSKNKHKSSSSSSNSVTNSDPNNPSNFQKNPNLKNSFWGLAYTPQNAILPQCGADLNDVITDIQLISQLTTRLRLYGADCNITSFVLDAIARTKVNVTVWVGNYVEPNDDAGYQRQRDELETAFKSFGVDHVSGVTVGNEFMLNYMTDNNIPATQVNGAAANAGAQQLISKIQDTKTWLQGLNLPKNLPVGTSDAGSYFNNEVLTAADYGMSNVHAWFADQTADEASGWVAEFFESTNVQPAALLSNKPQMYIAETGWPTGANDTAHASNGAGTASVSGLQTFIDDFVCQANTNGTEYFFFEVFDEPWKEAQFGGVEGHWGLFNSDKTFKDLKLPSC